MMRLIVAIFSFVAFHANACLDDRFHQGFVEPKGMPKDVQLSIPVAVRGIEGNVEFDIGIITDKQIDNLAIKLIPNPRVSLQSNAHLLVRDQLSHTVKAYVNRGQRGAIRVMVSGVVDGAEFMENRFIMLM